MSLPSRRRLRDAYRINLYSPLTVTLFLKGLTMTDYIRRYESVGILEHGGTTPSVECRCVATQGHDGDINLECLAPTDGTLPVNWWSALFGQPMNAMTIGRIRGLRSTEGPVMGHSPSAEGPP